MGAITALLDEYKRSINDLCETIKTITDQQLEVVVDENTKDPDCRSIQTVLSHVVQSGYTYVIEIRNWMGEEVEYKTKVLLSSSSDYEIALKDMFIYTQKLFSQYPDITLENYTCDEKMKVRWGQRYDVEQIMEHAIVHILRHRRQIENFKIGL